MNAAALPQDFDIHQRIQPRPVANLQPENLFNLLEYFLHTDQTLRQEYRRLSRF
ncbi:hypothetical protein [Mycobacterium sp.]|uniref:hypothetical protein n=1 Tax=Mycobacterium sp. TaxID=1785 RepID=UPI003D6A6CA2